MLKHCIRNFRLNITESNEQSIFLSVPGVVKEIHLVNAGIHKGASQNLYNIDFGGLLPDGVQVTTHTAVDNSFLTFYDLKFDVNQRIDGQYKISATLADGTLLDTGSIIISLSFGYE